MKKLTRILLLVALVIAVLLTREIMAGTPESTSLTGLEAKMFTKSADYELFMGRWSRLLAPAHIAFAGVKDGTKSSKAQSLGNYPSSSSPSLSW